MSGSSGQGKAVRAPDYSTCRRGGGFIRKEKTYRVKLGVAGVGSSRITVRKLTGTWVKDVDRMSIICVAVDVGSYGVLILCLFMLSITTYVV